jgi:hypothetical protein
MLLTNWDTEEHNRMIERHLQAMREVAESDRLARSARTPRAPRKLRRAMGGALIAAGRALAA